MEVLARELEEALHRGLLAAELLGQLAGVLGGELRGSPPGSAPGRPAADRRGRRPAGRRRSPSAGGPRPAAGRCRRRSRRSASRARSSAVGSSRCAGRRRSSWIRRSTRMWSWTRSSNGSRQMSSTVSAPTSASRSAPACSANRCSASSRSSAAARSRSQRDAHQLVLADGVAGAAAAVGDVGLDRPEVLAAVEDHGQRLGEAQRRDPQGDRGGGLGVDQCPLEQVVCVFSVHVVLPRTDYRCLCLTSLPPRGRNTPPPIGQSVGTGKVGLRGTHLQAVRDHPRHPRRPRRQAALQLRLDEDRRRGPAEGHDRGRARGSRSSAPRRCRA